ncbi:MAG: MBL fold metallo-hydrolase [Bacteroidales bacterium]|jgi:phosphoribosyl 1,2-cyclic phosphate phosphodiesterase|nr:MBL fold metallo-hydrolase [Bacteroidales bacterium]HHT52024.1 MBL fold metallo-hydrolase [Bacteroidales bacterium]
MKITFLGTGTSQGVPVIGCPCAVCNSQDPRDIRLRSSALITVGSKNILIDAGPDLRQQLLNNKITQVDAILMTHEHKDHTGGLDDVRPLNFMIQKVMQIYGLQRVLNVIRKDYDYAFKKNKYPGSPEFQLNIIKDEEFTIDDLLIEPISIRHLTLPILGYKINNMAYITDASFIAPSEISKLKDIDLLVINALRHKEHYSHFNLTQALQVINEINPKRAYLTHISHEMGQYIDIAPTLPDHIFMAYDGLEVEI